MSLIWTNRQEFQPALDKGNQARINAGRIAVRVEANRLRKRLKLEIKTGSPGGKTFQDLSVIGKRTGRPQNRTALRRLAIPVRYWESARPAGGSIFSVGYQADRVLDIHGRSPRMNQAGTRFLAASRLSASWLRLATLHQEGGRVPITDAKRQHLRRFGADLAGRRTKALQTQARYFFLKKSTTEFKQPARPIIAPFWFAYRSSAISNIQRNYQRKRAGERI